MADYHSSYTGQEIDEGISKANTAVQSIKTVNGKSLLGNGDIVIPEGKSAYEVYVEEGGTLNKEEWLASLSKGTPKAAENLEWLNEYGDHDKVYVLPDGYIYGWALATHPGYTNLFDLTQVTLNKRRSSTGALKDASGYVVTNKISIPASYLADNSVPLTVRFRPSRFQFPGDVMGLSNVAYYSEGGTHVSYTLGTVQTAHDDYNGDRGFYLLYNSNPAPEHAMSTSNIATFDLTLYSGASTELTEDDVKDIIITLGEPIEDITSYAWVKMFAYSSDVNDLNLEVNNTTLSLRNNNTVLSSVELPIEPAEIDNPCDYKGNEITVFNKGVCIGDSITKGAFDVTNAIFEDEKYSYPTQLSKLTSITIENWGITGKTSVGWWAEKGSSDFNGFDFAIVNLGINDVAKGISISDSQTALINIINALKQANNGIKIFLATIIPGYADNTSSYDAINNVIRNLANTTENCYLVDLTNYSYTHKGTAYVNGHLTALGYNRLAKDYIAYISYLINQNKNDFKFIQYIGTNYA